VYFLKKCFLVSFIDFLSWNTVLVIYFFTWLLTLILYNAFFFFFFFFFVIEGDIVAELAGLLTCCLAAAAVLDLLELESWDYKCLKRLSIFSLFCHTSLCVV
jgi:hypothetical protein